MKIAVCSDLHLEFDTLTLENTENAQVLILGGDICVAADLMDKDDAGIFDRFDRSRGLHEFFQMCCNNFSDVVYIAGNHEHYNGDFAKTFEILRTRLAYLPNLHILDKETFVLDDVTFIGGTLWTDMNHEDSLTLKHIRGMMNDFRCVTNSNHPGLTYKYPQYALAEDGGSDYTNVVGYDTGTKPVKFSPQDAVDDHKLMLEYIATVIEGKFDKKFVVVGHHAPSKQSTHPRYKDEELVNGAYSSDLNDFIIDHPQIKLWTHGHTHEDFDYKIGSTRVVCNPRGYANYEDRADHFKLKFVEV